MSENGVCENCPMAVTLNTAIEVIDKYPHNSPKPNRGAIELTRFCLERVASMIECPGMVSDANNRQLVCPLMDSANGARGIGAGIWAAPNWAVDLGKISPDFEESSENKPPLRGQYL